MKKNEEIKVEETVVEEVKVETTEVAVAEPEKEKWTTKLANGAKTVAPKAAKIGKKLVAGGMLVVAGVLLGSKLSGKGDSSEYDDYSYGGDNESSSDYEAE